MNRKSLYQTMLATLVALFILSTTMVAQGNFSQGAGGNINNGTGGILVVKGTTIDFNAQTSVTGTVDYARATTSQTIAAVSYQNLKLTGTGTPGATTRAFPNAAVQVSGDLTLASITKADVTAKSGTSAAIDYNGGTQAVATLDYYSLIFSGVGTKTFASGNTNIAKNFTISAGTADATTNSTTITYDGALAVAQTVAAINYHNLTIAANARAVTLSSSTDIGIRGAFSADAGNTYTTASTTINYNGTIASGFGAQTIAAFPYNNLTISGARVSDVVTLATSGTIAIAGTFSPTATFSTGNYDVTSSAINYTGGDAQGIVGGATFPLYHNLTISGAGTKPASGNIALTATGALTNSVILNMDTYTLGFTIAPTNTGTVQFAGLNNGKPVGSGSGTVEYTGAIAQNVYAGTYYDLKFTNGTSGSAEKTVAGAVQAENNMTVNASGFLTVSGTGTVQVDNDLTNNGAITNSGTITVGL